MAHLLVELHWDSDKEEVKKTYKVLSAGSDDIVQFVTHDRKPFLIETQDQKLAESLGLEKFEKAAGRNDLYQVKKADSQGQTDAPQRKTIEVPSPLPDWLKLQCGTFEQGRYVKWGGVGPDGY